MAPTTERTSQDQQVTADTSAIDFERLLTLCDTGVLEIDTNGQLRFASPSAITLLGYAPDALAQHLGDLVYLQGPDDPDRENLHRILTGDGQADAIPRADVQLRTSRGQLIWVEANAHMLRDAGGRLTGYAVFLCDMGRYKKLETQLEAATRTDALTGLYNKRAFDDTVRREWAVAMREQTHITLVRVAIDRFDEFSAVAGATATAGCLQKVAKTLKDTARRPADFVARMGPGEFAMLLPRTHEMGAETISAYVHLAVRDLAMPDSSTGSGGHVTVSVGAICCISLEARHRAVVEILLDAAEENLARAQQAGGDQVQVGAKTLGSAG